jgi:hypothetical protein
MGLALPRPVSSPPSPAVDETTVVTLVGIAAATVVALVTHRQRLAHERRMKHDDENRAVLDAAAEALMAAVREAPDVVRTAMHDEPDAADRELAWLDTFAGAVTQQARLYLRLGHDHPVAKAYDAALVPLRKTIGDVQQLRLEGGRHAEIDERGHQGRAEVAPLVGDFVDAGLLLAHTTERDGRGAGRREARPAR